MHIVASVTYITIAKRIALLELHNISKDKSKNSIPVEGIMLLEQQDDHTFETYLERFAEFSWTNLL